MKKILMTVLCCIMAANAMAQSQYFITWMKNHGFTIGNEDGNTLTEEDDSIYMIRSNGFMSHLEVGVTFSNAGIGCDAATPLTPWAKLRAGLSIRPKQTYECTLNTEIAEGVAEEEQKRRFDKLFAAAGSLLHSTPPRTIEVSGGVNIVNLKVLVDFYPLKDKNFHITAGIYYGTGTIVKGESSTHSGTMLAAMNIYNAFYDRAMANQTLDISASGMSLGEVQDKLNAKMRDWGRMSIPVGTYSHDIRADQNIYYPYDVLDENGNTLHEAGSLRYAQGDVIYRKGETVRLTPGANDVLRIDAKVNKLKPYIGVGYSLPITKDKRSKISLDAGILYWGGHPAVCTAVEAGGSDANNRTARTDIDLTRDVSDISGKLGELVAKAKKYVVMPELTLRFSQSIW